MRKTLIMVVGIVLCCTLGQAEVWKLHQGSLDPDTEGWTFDDYNGGTGTQSAGSDSEDYWRIQRDDGAAGRYLGTLGGMQIGDPEGWTMTARVKVNTAVWVSDCEIAVLDATSWWGINLCADPSGYLGVYTYSPALGVGSALASFDPSQDYHTYQIIYTPGDGMGGGDAVTYYIDGEEVGAQMRSDVHQGYGIYRAQFGDTNGLAASDSQWSFVSWETGQNVWVPDGAIPGDANIDGVVNEDDAAVLAANWLKQGGAVWREGDFNKDGNVDDIDATLLATNWQTSGPASAAVPEPGTLGGLLTIGILYVFAHARRKRKYA